MKEQNHTVIRVSFDTGYSLKFQRTFNLVIFTYYYRCVPLEAPFLFLYSIRAGCATKSPPYLAPRGHLARAADAGKINALFPRPTDGDFEPRATCDGKKKKRDRRKKIERKREKGRKREREEKEEQEKEEKSKFHYFIYHAPVRAPICAR